MKTPKPRKLKSGSWFIQLRLNGISVPVTEATEAECKRQADLIKAEYLAGKREIQANNLTLTKAIDKYIEKRKNTLSPSTIAGYRRIQKNRFQDYMSKKLSDLTDLQTMCDQESKSCSPRTLKNSFRLVQSVLKENGIKTKPVTMPVMVPKTRPYLEPEQIKTLVESIKGSRAELPVLFALHSLRRSEILALDWSNIDLGKKRFKVSGSVVEDENGKYINKKENKNASSTRTLPIMIPELEAALKAIPEEKRTGKLFSCIPDTLTDRINQACENAGLPKVGPHGLRHTFASLAYHLGMSELETMELGGWSDTQTMHRIYTHLAASDRLKAENKMTAFFANANKNANENPEPLKNQ